MLHTTPCLRAETNFQTSLIIGFLLSLMKLHIARTDKHC